MAPKILFLPIYSASLPHYFGRGIILPSKYYSNKPDDLQSSYNDSLFLSPNIWVAGADCSLAIVLTENEEKFLVQASNGFLFSGAIPISRVNQVYFASSEQKKNTIYNINAGTAYIPERLVTVMELTEKPLNPPIQFGKIDVSSSLADKIKRFDILMGGIAFMSVAKAKGSNFPKDYFSVLGTFNTLIKSQLIEAQHKGVATYDDTLTGVFISSRKNTRWSGLQSLIFDNVGVEIVEKMASKEKVKIEKKFGMIDLSEMDTDSNLFSLAILATYGNKKSRSVEELISLLKRFDDEKAQEIALIFGLNVRYSGLRSKYEGQEIPVKFRLVSRLDYYIIESIYQFVFNSIKDSAGFEYIDSWVPEADRIMEEGIPHYDIIDVRVSAKKKSIPVNLYSEKFEMHAKKLQEKFNEFGKYVFEETRKLAENGFDLKIAELEYENAVLKDTVKGLELSIKVEMAKAEELWNKFGNVKELNSTLDCDGELGIEPVDELEYLDLKELKKMAKLKGISSVQMSKFKSTKNDLAAFIKLIRETKTLL